MLRDHEEIAVDIVEDAFPDVAIAIYPYGWSGQRVMVVTLSGPRAGDAAALLEQRVACFARAELLEAADGASVDELDVALLRVVSSASDEPDDAVIDRVSRALHADLAGYRQAALRAIVIRPWPAFVPLVEHTAANDPDEATRLQARITLMQLHDPPPPWS